MHSCSDTYIDPFYHLANYCTSISTRSLFYCCSVVLFCFFLLPRFLHLSGSPLTDCVLDGFYQDGCIKRESDVKDLLVKKYYKVIKYNNWPNYKMDQCKYLNNYAPTPPLTQQRTINDMLDIVGLKEE